MKETEINQPKHESLFTNNTQPYKQALDNIVFQKRDNGYISDAYRGDIDLLVESLDSLDEITNLLDPNVLFRVMSHEKAGIINMYIKNNSSKKLNQFLKLTASFFTDEPRKKLIDDEQLMGETCELEKQARPADVPYNKYMIIENELAAAKEVIYHQAMEIMCLKENLKHEMQKEE